MTDDTLPLPPPEPRAEDLRLAEALLFASAEPVTPAGLASVLPDGADVASIVAALQAACAGRGVEVATVAGGWQMRTAPDLAPLLRRRFEVPKRLTRAAVETLSVIAYHQPVTRAEIEEIRGVSLAQGTLDTLMEGGFVEPGPRRETPGRPATWGTTPRFLAHFGLGALKDLPKLEELKAAGLLELRPAAFEIAAPASPDIPADPPAEPLDPEGQG